VTRSAIFGFNVIFVTPALKGSGEAISVSRTLALQETMKWFLVAVQRTFAFTRHV
jgi:hypothetical protein